MKSINLFSFVIFFFSFAFQCRESLCAWIFWVFLFVFVVPVGGGRVRTGPVELDRLGLGMTLPVQPPDSVGPWFPHLKTKNTYVVVSVGGLNKCVYHMQGIWQKQMEK